MKINKAVTETVINYIHLTFEKEHLDLGEFKVLIIASGISRQDASEFVCENKINYQRLEEKIALNNNFFIELISNFLAYLLPTQRNAFKDIMKKSGYILGTNKLFRKAKKTELVDYEEEDKIKKIEIYKDERNRFRIAVNSKLIPWQSPKGKADKSYLEYIYEIAESGKAEAIYADKARGVQQWFNTKKNNPIYKYTKIKPTKILEYKGEFFYPASGVIFTKMTQKKAYSK